MVGVEVLDKLPLVLTVAIVEEVDGAVRARGKEGGEGRQDSGGDNFQGLLVAGGGGQLDDQGGR